MNKLIFLILALAAGFCYAQAPVQRNGDTRTPLQFRQDCARGISPDTCAKPPAPRGCPPGQHWTTAGTGIAHCVGGDPVCPPGSVVDHDSRGNPFCRALPVPVPPPPPPPECAPQHSRSQVLPCPSGFSGTRDVFTNTACDAAGNVIPAPSNTEDHCVQDAAPVPPPCVSSSVVLQTSDCAANQVGGPIRLVQTVSCPGNVVQISATGACAPRSVTCVAQTVNNPAQSCPPGFTGNALTTTSISCPSGPFGSAVQTTSPVDFSGCVPDPVCANGATDFPVCTVPTAPSVPDCAPVPGPVSGGIADLPLYCQGQYGRPPGMIGDSFRYLICGNGASGCHCAFLVSSCTRSGWTDVFPF